MWRMGDAPPAPGAILPPGNPPRRPAAVVLIADSAYPLKGQGVGDLEVGVFACAHRLRRARIPAVAPPRFAIRPGPDRAGDRTRRLPRPRHRPLPGKIEALAGRVRDRCPRGGEAAVAARADQLGPVRRGRVPGEHRGLLRPAEQLPQRGDRPQDGHPDHAVGAVLVDCRGGRAGRWRGVNLPAHFMLRVGSGDSTIFVDPFHAGAVLDREVASGGSRRWSASKSLCPTSSSPPAATTWSWRGCSATSRRSTWSNTTTRRRCPSSDAWRR